MKKGLKNLFQKNKRERAQGFSLIKCLFSVPSPLVWLTRYKEDNVPNEQMQPKSTDDNDEFHVLYSVTKLLR